MTPQTLTDAVRSGDLQLVEEILAADPRAAEARGPAGESLLLLAAYHGRADIAARLAAVASPDLHEAAAIGDAARVARLLGDAPDRAALLDARSFDGWTALHLAAFFGRLDAARSLLDAGASVTAVSANAIANQPLHAALAGRTDPALVRLLLDRGASVTATYETGITPLHLAASRGDGELCDALVARGADASARMDDGKLPADLAEERGHPELAARLRALAGGTR